MSCPFYAHALVSPGMIGLVEIRKPHLIANVGSNQCALITSAHSPCWMEVSEQVSPEWSVCPRNPEFGAIRPHDRRIAEHFDHLEHLMRLRPPEASR